MAGHVADTIVMWESVEWPGAEHLSLREGPMGIEVDGMVVALVERPIRLHYRIDCDARWTTRRLDVEEAVSGARMTFLSDGGGTWTDGSGRVLDELAGCIDVDIAATPFTNTLPIRRIAFEVGEVRDLRMLWLLVPEVTVRAADQRYTCLEKDATGALYRYQSGSFQADLRVDAAGIVIDYPELWRRIWPAGTW
jgi:hypothetical protein